MRHAVLCCAVAGDARVGRAAGERRADAARAGHHFDDPRRAARAHQVAAGRAAAERWRAEVRPSHSQSHCRTQTHGTARRGTARHGGARHGMRSLPLASASVLSRWRHGVHCRSSTLLVAAVPCCALATAPALPCLDARIVQALSVAQVGDGESQNAAQQCRNAAQQCRAVLGSFQRRRIVSRVSLFATAR